MANTPMFSDRRASPDRREQQLPMPAGQNRRSSSRRDGNFNSKPWWLQVDYSEELVSEQECAKQLREITARRKAMNKQALEPEKQAHKPESQKK